MHFSVHKPDQGITAQHCSKVVSVTPEKMMVQAMLVQERLFLLGGDTK
jgi:hypothetical protein